MWDNLIVWPQYILPQHQLSRIAYHLTRCRLGWVKNSLIKLFIQVFNVNMDEAIENDPQAYSSFNHFFTRELMSNIRPVSETGLISPVDGVISQMGKLCETTLLQAKGKNYEISSLLANIEDITMLFHDGNYATIYLSPRDYHRIHMPIDGTLNQMIYVPGRLFSVNACTTRVVDNLFTRNERLICLFDTHIGPVAMILVGAIFVGNIETVWHGEINTANRSIQTWQYHNTNQPIKLKRGQEMGRFNMGSTVILLFRKNTVTWRENLFPGSTIKFGQVIAEISDHN